MRRAIGIGILLLIVGCTPKPLITEEQRRSHLLMPNKTSEPFKAWVAEYGDTADSWLLFTVDFHTKYIGQLDKRIQALTAALEAYPDPNEIFLTPNEAALEFMRGLEEYSDPNGMNLDPNGTTTTPN